jgi:hypothetical protein
MPANLAILYSLQSPGSGVLEGSGNCRMAGQIATLAAPTWSGTRGVTKATNSHFGVANQQFALLQPHRAFEELHALDTDAAFRAKVDTALTNFNDTGPYRAAHKQFDSLDTGPVLQSANCTFDFNPNDN